jgi:hypothetical protein
MMRVHTAWPISCSKDSGSLSVTFSFESESPPSSSWPAKPVVAFASPSCRTQYLHVSFSHLEKMKQNSRTTFGPSKPTTLFAALVRAVSSKHLWLCSSMGLSPKILIGWAELDLLGFLTLWLSIRSASLLCHKMRCTPHCQTSYFRGRRLADLVAKHFVNYSGKKIYLEMF